MQKSSGVTPTEKYLVRLCERAFLRLWSYPNLYRDQGGGKELCDVLIVFGRDIIIFSDKSCAYPDTGDEVKDWARWFKRSIKESAGQVYGAERWILQHPNRIFLDPGCKHPLSLRLPPSDEMRIHRVVVARGAGERCSAFFGGDSGSLMVRNDLVGHSHVNPPAGPFGIFVSVNSTPRRGTFMSLTTKTWISSYPSSTRLATSWPICRARKLSFVLKGSCWRLARKTC